MRDSKIIKFMVTYFIRAIVSGLTGFSYNLFTDQFNFINLIIDLAIWTVIYIGVDLSFSKLSGEKNNTSNR